MTPAATGTDTAGSLRIPSALSGTSTLKLSRGLVSLRGAVPLAPTLDHAGPMARTPADCSPLLAALLGLPGPLPAGRTLAELRIAVSPRLGLVELDADVAAGFERALAACGAELVEPPPPDAPLDVGDDFIAVVLAELLSYHRRFDAQRELYRPSLREMGGERRGAGALRRGVPRRAGAPRGDDVRLGRLARRARDRRGDRADRPGRRAAARRRLRPRVHRRSADLADALLGLDGLPRGGASGGCRPTQRAAGRRFARRPARPRLRRARRRRRADHCSSSGLRAPPRAPSRSGRADRAGSPPRRRRGRAAAPARPRRRRGRNGRAPGVPPSSAPCG